MLLERCRDDMGASPFNYHLYQAATLFKPAPRFKGVCCLSGEWRLHFEEALVFGSVLAKASAPGAAVVI